MESLLTEPIKPAARKFSVDEYYPTAEAGIHEGKIGEHWGKNGVKFPIVRHGRIDLRRSVRRDA
jgi:hypothetical protein